MQPTMKTVVLQAPGSIPTNAATTTTRLDCLGYDYATIDLIMGIAGDTAKPTTLSIVEGDTTTYASASAITTLTGGGVGGFTIPALDNTTMSVIQFRINLLKRKRYLFTTLAPANVTNTCIVAHLYKGEEPYDAATQSTVVGTTNMLAMVED